MSRNWIGWLIGGVVLILLVGMVGALLAPVGPFGGWGWGCCPMMGRWGWGFGGMGWGFGAVMMLIGLLIPLLLLGLVVAAVVWLIRQALRATGSGAPPAARCPSCGRPVQPEWTHCPYCGAPLRGSPPAPTA